MRYRPNLIGSGIPKIQSPGLDAISAVPDQRNFTEIDIEGEEYGFVDELVEFSRTVAGIIIEVHDMESTPEWPRLIEGLLERQR